MDKEQEKRSEQAQQPGNLDSFNNRDNQRSGEVETTKGEKDESESYMDYNGNSEANAPVREEK